MDEDFNFESFQQEEIKPGQKGGKDTINTSSSSDFIQVSRRLKVLEEGSSNQRKKMLVDEQNDINRHKKELMDFRNIQTEISELKKEFENIKRVIKEIINELRDCARKDEVDVLKRYTEMWDPMKFVSEETVEKMIDDKIGNSSE